MTLLIQISQIGDQMIWIYIYPIVIALILLIVGVQIYQLKKEQERFKLLLEIEKKYQFLVIKKIFEKMSGNGKPGNGIEKQGIKLSKNTNFGYTHYEAKKNSEDPFSRLNLNQLIFQRGAGWDNIKNIFSRHELFRLGYTFEEIEMIKSEN